ncbi:MAG: hypothetical protein HQK51_00585 [Oligoflexia bacterium]|nr:hypothetical protein [Oligoflexia bacterium]
MLSKFSIWDFKPNKNQGQNNLINNETLIINLLVEDLFMQKFILEEVNDILKLNIKTLETEITSRNAKECSLQWFQQELLTPTLWDNNQVYVIQACEEFNKDKINFLIKNKTFLNNINCKLIMLFSKEVGAFQQLHKESIGSSIKIETPRFYEFKKLLTYLINKLDIKNLSEEAKNYFCEVIKPTSCDYYTNLMQIKILSQSQKCASEKLDAVGLQKLLLPETNHLDFFKLAKIFSKKNYKEFFATLITNMNSNSKNIDSNALLSFAIFMQNHLLKISDPSYLKHKTKLNRYDQAISSYSKNWNNVEIKRALRFFATIEISNKFKDPILMHSLALKLLILK